MRQIGVLTSAARVAVDEIFLSGVHLPYANSIAKDLEQTWVSLGGLVQHGLDQETNMVWLDLKGSGVKDGEFVKIAAEEGLKVFDGRIVTHYRKLWLPKLLQSLLQAFIFREQTELTVTPIHRDIPRSSQLIEEGFQTHSGSGSA